MTRPFRLAARFAAADAALCTAVVAVRLAYENPDTLSALAAGTAAIAFLAALSLLISAALSYGWHAVHLAADARYVERLRATRPLGPVGRRGYQVCGLDPNDVYEALEDAETQRDAQESHLTGRHSRSITPEALAEAQYVSEVAA